MTEKDQLKIAQMTKLHPVLNELGTDEEKLKCIRESQKTPFLWITLIIILGLWIYFLGPVIMNVTSEKNIIILFVKLILPAFLPIALILYITIRVQRMIIKKIVRYKDNQS